MIKRTALHGLEITVMLPARMSADVTAEVVGVGAPTRAMHSIVFSGKSREDIEDALKLLKEELEKALAGPTHD